MFTKKRLIDATHLEAVFQNLVKSSAGTWSNPAYLNALERLQAAPTVDAVEVVHGRWVVDDADSGELGAYAAFLTVHCSKCGCDYSVESGQYGWYLGDPFPYHYCPNCGAKMDGERRAQNGQK
jgi:hypothetical protein